MHTRCSRRADARLDGLAVDGDPERLAVRQQRRPGADARERLSPAAMMLAPVDEACVDAERDVVQEQPLVRAADVDAAFLAAESAQRGNRIAAVQPEVACEVVARPERDAHERDVKFERNLGNGREGAVSARHAERIGACGLRHRAGILALA
jgi:hypothetical protein